MGSILEIHSRKENSMKKLKKGLTKKEYERSEKVIRETQEFTRRLLKSQGRKPIGFK